MTPEKRKALVLKISMAMAKGEDCGGYDTLLDMYAHTALKVMEDEGALYEEGYTNGFEDGVRSGHFTANSQHLMVDQQ